VKLLANASSSMLKYACLIIVLSVSDYVLVFVKFLLCIFRRYIVRNIATDFNWILCRGHGFVYL